MKFIIIFILFSFSFSYSQENTKVDTVKIYYSLKFKVLDTYSKTTDKNRLKIIDSIITKTNLVVVKQLKSKGFNNVIFYKITNIIIPQELEHEYIVAFQTDNNKYFRIKGFVNNDFYYLFKFETRIDSESPTNLITKKSKKNFLKNHYIEEIDLDCLVKYINSKEHWSIPCLNPSNKILIDDYGEEYW
jgi:hypothetical protein